MLANRDRDLRKREGDDRNGNGNGSRTEKKSASAGALDCLENTVRKGLSTTRLIRSRDTAPPPPLLPQPNPHPHWVNTPSTLLLPDPILTPTTRYQEDGPLYPTYMTTCLFPPLPALADPNRLGKVRSRSQSHCVPPASRGNSDPSTHF